MLPYEAPLLIHDLLLALLGRANISVGVQPFEDALGGPECSQEKALVSAIGRSETLAGRSSPVANCPEVGIHLHIEVNIVDCLYIPIPEVLHLGRYTETAPSMLSSNRYGHQEVSSLPAREIDFRGWGV